MARDLLSPAFDPEASVIWPWPRGVYWRDIHPGVWIAANHPPGTRPPRGKRGEAAGDG